MKRWMIITILILLVLAVPLVHLRVRTMRAVARITGLQGRVGDFAIT